MKRVTKESKVDWKHSSDQELGYSFREGVQESYFWLSLKRDMN